MKPCVICKDTDQRWTACVHPHNRGEIIALLDDLTYVEEARKSEGMNTFIDVVFSWIADDNDRTAVIDLLESHLCGEVEFVERVDHTARLIDLVAKLKEIENGEV